MHHKYDAAAVYQEVAVVVESINGVHCTARGATLAMARHMVASSQAPRNDTLVIASAARQSPVLDALQPAIVSSRKKRVDIIFRHV